MNERNENDQKVQANRPQGEMPSGEGMYEGKLAQAGVHESHIDRFGRELADDRAGAGKQFDMANGCGQLLRTERLKRGLSVSEVARRLRLSVQQVNAIEEEDYSKLPSGTFLRGFVRNYGSLLQLDTNSLLRLLAQSVPVPDQQSLARHVKAIPLVSSKRMNGGRSVLWVTMALILTLLGYGMYRGGDWGQGPGPVMEESISINPLPDSQTENGQVTMELFLPQAPSTLSRGADIQELPGKRLPEMGLAAIAPPVVEPPVVEPIESNEKTLHFTFSRDSWVEIRDSNRKVIFVKTNPKGTEQVITGIPPFYLVVGNASGVNLTYNGRLVDLAPYTRKNDDVARFSLE